MLIERFDDMDDQLIDSFLNYLRATKAKSENTTKAYAEDLFQFLEYLKQRKLSEPVLLNINHLHIRGFLAHLRDRELSKRTVARKLSTLRSFYKYLIVEGFTKENVAKMVQAPKTSKRLPLFLYPQEIERLLSAPKKDILGIRDRAILELLYATGMRVGELVALKIGDINFGANYIIVFGKGSKERIVFFGQKAAESLDEYLIKSRPHLVKNFECDSLFLNKNGTQLSDRSVRRIIDKYVKAAALSSNISPHTFRHTFATHMLNNGADLKTVQELLGHSSLSTTQIYTHVTKERLKEVYEKAFPYNKG